MFVLDASVLVNWSLPEARDACAEAARSLLKKQPATAPSLLWFEFHNVLVTREWRKQLSPVDTTAILISARTLPIQIDKSTDFETTLALSRKHRLTFYDASYLELARRKFISLATLDNRLRTAARSEGILLVGTTEQEEAPNGPPVED